MLSIPTFKGVIEDEEVIREIGKGPEVGRESGENCVREAKRGQHFNNNNSRNPS